MENNPEQKESPNSQQETKNIEEQPKPENIPTEIPLKTEMCQLIYYDFSVK